jgi:tripartite-type tricarboxylate transporter receptor subunit TctC
MRPHLPLFAALAGLAFAAPDAAAQPWPSRSVMIIVPFTAGTTSDVVGRAVAEYLGKTIGKPVVIDNRGGAGGNVGAGLAAHAQPNGYTLLLATTAQAATNKLMYTNMSFDPQKDFAPIALVGKAPIIVVTPVGAPIKTLSEAIEYATANPDKLSAGYPGSGTLGHITGILLQQRTGIKLREAQYRGTSQIITDLLGQHIDIGIDSMGGYVSNIKNGKLRALGIASAKRWPLLPEVQTVAESGLSGFEASVWYALLAPVGTPPEIVIKLNQAVNDFLGTESAEKLFMTLGLEAAGGTPQDLHAFIASEIEKWAPIIKAADIKF